MFDEIINKAMEEADNHKVINEGDYYEDGLLHCGVCKKKKETIVKLGNFDRKVGCICDCEKQREKELAEDQRKRQIMHQVERLRSSGFTDAEMSRMTFDNDDGANPKLTKIAKRYVELFPDMLKNGKGLLLYGDVGGGKTFISACIANALIDRLHPCMVTNFARLANKISERFEGRQEYLDSLNRFDLLVIDDLGAERDSEYMAEIVMTVIDARYRCKKPLIVTTNLTADDLQDKSNIRKERIYSRLFEMCYPIKVESVDRRLAKSLDDFKEFTEKLGFTV